MSSERVPLPGALGQIADGAAATQAARDLAGAGLPLAQMHTAARRRRVTFGAGVAVGAAAVVGVLVLGAAAAGGLIDRDPTPPVQTPDSAGWDVDYSPCGQTLVDLDRSASSGPVDLFAYPPQTDTDAVVTVFTFVGTLDEETVSPTQVSRRTELLTVVDGVVVGVFGTPEGEAADELLPVSDDPLDLTSTVTSPAFSCEARDGVTRMPAGGYNLTVSRRVVADGAEQVAVGSRPLTIPAADVLTAAGALPAVEVSGPVPECGETFEGPAPGDTRMHVRLIFSESPLGGGSLMPNATIDLINDVPGTDALPLAAITPMVVTTRDGVVIGQSRRDASAAPFTLRPSAATVVADMQVNPNCSAQGGLTAGDVATDARYLAWVVVDAGTAATFVAGPWPLGSEARAWVDIDPSALPSQVPVIEGAVLRSRVRDDGGMWQVTVEASETGRETYATALGLLTDAGFAVTDEQTDATRPAWHYAVLTDADYTVELDVSNETGGGFYADYAITSR